MATIRARNNVASKKSYEKEQERLHATEYEYEMIRQHALLPNMKAHHWSNVPEDWLYEAGYITSYNKHRLKRLMNKKEKKEGTNRLKDYGLDGLAKDDVTGMIHGLQAKYYLSRSVTGEDIGTFLTALLRLITKNNQSKGYLYSPNKLQADLADSVADPEYPVKHVLHPWRHPDKRCESKKAKVEQKEYETPLRDYQKDALAVLSSGDGIHSLILPCRMGKTLIAGHDIQKKSPSLLIAMAPLKASVENLHERLPGFLSNYKVMLVDSDQGGITDPETVRAFLINTDTPRIVFTTYESATNVLQPLLEAHHDILEGAYVLADEVHNATEAQCEFINTFSTGLVMTATFPDELGDLLDIQETYQMTFQDAIQGGWVCDYTLFLPAAFAEGHPIEFDTYGDDLKAKVHFLATTMLAQGSRRAIVYLTSKKECEEFRTIAEQEFHDYFGVPVWTNVMTCDTSKMERKEMLETFQSNENSIFSILASIKILDEAVDIPRCDSVFITKIGEHSSDIRMVQRMMRSATKDATHPSKHNNVLLWADGWESCTGALDLLRISDPEFHKKIRYAMSEYDGQDVATSREWTHTNNQEMANVVQQWTEMRGMTLEERFQQNVTKLTVFRQVHKRWPSKSAKDKEEKRLGEWCHGQQKAKKKNKLSAERIASLTAIGFVWSERVFAIREDWDIIKTKVEAFYQMHKRWPSPSAKDKEDKRLGTWCTYQQDRKKKNKLSAEQIASLTTMGFVWSETIREDWDIMKHKVETFYQMHNRWPSYSPKDKEEKRLGTWCITQRTAKKANKLSDERIASLTAIGFVWRVNGDWDIMKTKMEVFHQMHNRWPSSSAKDKEEKRLGEWRHSQQKEKKKNTLSDERIASLTAIGFV